jgi:hypothetical protein
VTLRAGDCELYSEYLHVIGTVEAPGVARDAAVAGSLAYVAVDKYTTSGGELWIIDTSDPAAPESLGVADLPWPAYGVAVSGTIACIAAREGGLVVVDVADPTEPAMVGHLDTPSMGFGVAVAGNLALLASYDAGLYIVDVANPAEPQVLGTLPTPDAAQAVEVQGNHAYVAVDWAGLLVADISDPAAPAAVTTLPLPGRARNVALAADHAYVAAGLMGGLQAIAIGDPTAPVVVGSVNVYNAFDVAVADDLLYVAGYLSFFTVDATDPSQMSILGEIGMGGGARGVAPAGNTVCVAASGQGLRLVDATEPRAVPMVGSIPVTGADDGGHVAWGSPHAYVVWAHCSPGGNCFAGLQVVGLADPSAPETVGTLALPPAAAGVALAGSHLLVGSSVGLLVIDVSDPAQPATTMELSTLAGTRTVVVAGARGYVAHGDLLTVLDLTEPATPIALGSVALPETALDLVVQGDLVFAAARALGLLILDVSDGDDPQLIAAIPAQSWARGLGVADRYAYVVGDGFCDVFDVADPTAPAVVGSVDPLSNFVRDAMVVDGELYVAAMSAGLEVYALTNPAAPSYLGSVSTGNYAHRLAASDTHVLVSDLDRLSVAPRQCSPTSVELPSVRARPVFFAYPNPFKPRISLEFELAADELVRLHVFDVRGRRVAELADRPFPAGTHRLVWDGRDVGGRSVASGTYFARLEVVGRSTARKIVLVR